jgi:N-acetylmuramoyl-L-alanine amidase
MKFATGIVKHTDQINAKRYDGVQTYYNWDNQSYHGQQLGFALLAREAQEPVLYDSELDHLMILNASNEAATYRFMAVWEEDPMQIRGIREFREHLEQEAAQWGTPFRMESNK